MKLHLDTEIVKIMHNTCSNLSQIFSPENTLFKIKGRSIGILSILRLVYIRGNTTDHCFVGCNHTQVLYFNED